MGTRHEEKGDLCHFFSLLGLGAALPHEPSTEIPIRDSNGTSFPTATSTNKPTPVGMGSSSSTHSCITTTNCTECLTSTDCLFIIFEETSQKCETIDYKPPSDSIEPTIIRDLSKCNSGGDDP